LSRIPVGAALVHHGPHSPCMPANREDRPWKNRPASLPGWGVPSSNGVPGAQTGREPCGIPPQAPRPACAPISAFPAGRLGSCGWPANARQTLNRSRCRALQGIAASSGRSAIPLRARQRGSRPWRKRFAIHGQPVALDACVDTRSRPPRATPGVPAGRAPGRPFALGLGGLLRSWALCAAVLRCATHRRDF